MSGRQPSHHGDHELRAFCATCVIIRIHTMKTVRATSIARQPRCPLLQTITISKRPTMSSHEPTPLGSFVYIALYFLGLHAHKVLHLM